MIALLFHLFFAWQLWQYPIHLYGDAVHYDHAAVVLLLKHVYTYWSWGPAAQVTPGYPIFLEGSYWLTLISTHNHQVQMHVATTIQHILAAFTVFFLYRLMRIGLPRYASLVGATLWLIYPPATSAADQLLTETLYIFFLVLFAWIFVVSVRQPSLVRFMLSGLLLALTTLVRPSVMPLVIAPLLLVLQARFRGQSLRQLAIYFSGYLGVFILCMLPWWIRNVRVMHRLILTDDDMANPLLYGSDPNFANDPNLAQGLNPHQQEALAIHRMMAGFEHQPLLYLKWYTWDKLGLLFGTPWFTKFQGTPSIVAVYANTHLFWVIVGTIGLVFVSIRKRPLWWVSALVLFLVVVQLPFIPINRYALPMMPFLFVGVACIVGEVGNVLSRGKIKRDNCRQLS